MKYFPVFIIFLWCVLAACLLFGCGHSNPDPTNGHNASIHKGTDKIVVNADTAAVAVNNAKVWLNTLIQRIEAWKADPAHNPAPTTNGVEDVLNHANAELDKAGPALADTKAEAGKVADESDRQKADAEKAIAAAKNEQRQEDERWGKIIVAFAVAAGVWLAFERFTSYTFLVAMIPAAIAGGIAYALFGTVLALITRAVTVAWYVGIVAGVAWLAFYVYKRSRNHGLAGLLRNVELNPTPASTAQTPKL